MTDPVSRVTYLFSDIEGSTLLWEAEPQRMHLALARHDALVRAAAQLLGADTRRSAVQALLIAASRSQVLHEGCIEAARLLEATFYR